MSVRTTGIEIIGMISTTLASEIYGKSIVTGAVDPRFIAEFARVHEDGGFDRVLVGYGSTGADGFVVTAHAAAATTRLGFLIAHRPGFVAPTLAARKAASLDHVTGGRIALHIITGGSDVEQQRDGDFLDHDARYRRTDEYLEVLRPARPQSVGSQRLLDLAAQGEIHDKRLWTAIAAATGAAGSTTALVGTAEQVADALLDYYDAGAGTVLIRGFDPLQDAIEFGRDLVPLVRAGVERRKPRVVAAGSPAP